MYIHITIRQLARRGDPLRGSGIAGTAGPSCKMSRRGTAIHPTPPGPPARGGSDLHSRAECKRNGRCSYFLVWIVKPSGCHYTDGHLTSRVFAEDQQIS